MTSNDNEAAAAPSRTQPERKLRFVVYSNPDDSKKRAFRKLVRAQAARDSRSKRSNAKSAALAPENRDTLPRAKEPVESQKAPTDSGPSETDPEAGSDRDVPLALLRVDPTTLEAFAVPEPASLLSSARTDPFDCFVRRLSGFEHFLIDHYVTVCLPVAESTMGWSAAERNAYIRAAVTDCITFSLGEPGMINALLLGACRGLAFCHGAGQKQSMFTQYALQYKLQLIQSASQAIVVEGDSPSNSTIAKSVTLALDDRESGNPDDLERHVRAIRRMVQIRGGRESLGLHGFLDDLIAAFLEPTTTKPLLRGEADRLDNMGRYEPDGLSRVMLESRGLYRR